MAQNKTVLFTSNCFGEDRSAAMIAATLKDRIVSEGAAGWDVAGASLISPGADYTSRGIELFYASELPPSGGFPTHSAKGFFEDLFSGSLGNLGRYRKRLRESRDRIGLVVVAGDVPLLWLTRRELKNVPYVFIDLPKSDYIEPHFAVEKRYMKRVCGVVFFRDELTAANMKIDGVPAEYFGNSLMDGLEDSGTGVAFDSKKPLIAFLPGSRDEAYPNFMKILDVVEHLAEMPDVQFAAALPGTLTDERIAELAAPKGWNYTSGSTSGLPFGTIQNGAARIVLTRGAFSGIVKASTLVIGLAGTANEQAAGLGKTVVAFKGSGPQTTRRRFAEQGRLLGEALRYVEGDSYDAASEVIRLLESPNELLRRGAEGMKRMGAPGASKRIADYLFDRYVVLKS